jgi:hypothetical protein
MDELFQLIEERDQLIEKEKISEEKKEENDSLRSQITEVQGVASERHARNLEQEGGLKIELEESKKFRKELTERVLRLELQVDTATNKHNTLILRQIATSFQHKAAKYCGVGTPGRQYCVTYDNLMNSKKGDAIKKNEVTTLIHDKGFDETDFSFFLQELRLIGTSGAHPATTYSGRTPNYDELTDIIQRLPEAGEITSNVKNDALKILELVQVLSSLVGTTDLLDCKS